MGAATPIWQVHPLPNAALAASYSSRLLRWVTIDEEGEVSAYGAGGRAAVARACGVDLADAHRMVVIKANTPRAAGCLAASRLASLARAFKPKN